METVVVKVLLELVGVEEVGGWTLVPRGKEEQGYSQVYGSLGALRMRFHLALRRGSSKVQVKSSDQSALRNSQITQDRNTYRAASWEDTPGCPGDWA